MLPFFVLTPNLVHILNLREYRPKVPYHFMTLCKVNTDKVGTFSESVE